MQKWLTFILEPLNVNLNSPPADEADEEFSDDQLLRLPPVGPPSWDSNVVCIQPTRNHSRPEGHEETEEKQTQQQQCKPLAVSTTAHLTKYTAMKCTAIHALTSVVHSGRWLVLSQMEHLR